MKIKRIEIIGFKSFVDRTVLNFEPGVTAILGPNGCGKSNVIDAIRWAMGEQNAKNLRGQAMEDVIFGGSKKRRPHGMAEVTMVFSNPHGAGTSEFNQYSEIMITRRLYRNGDSEYLLNKAPCRLKDISELFMDTGVGARAYSIIEQGKIGSILHSRPEERRVLIEEAAGVTKYKARKKTALRKIESTRQNLTRLNDVIAEVKRQRDSLRRQAGKAQRFRELRNQVKELEIQLARYRWMELEQEAEKLETQLEQAEQAVESTQITASTMELDFEKARIEQAEHDAKVRQLRDQLFQLDSDIQKIESQQELSRQQQRHMEEQQESLRVEVEAARQSESDSSGLIEQLTTQHERVREEATLLKEKRVQLFDTVSQQADRERECSSRVEQWRKEMLSSHVDLSRYEGQKSQSEQKLLSLKERQQRQKRERLDLEEQRQQLSEQLVSLDDDLTAGQEALAESREQLEEVTRQQRNEQEQRERVTAELRNQQKEYHQCASRLESLQELLGSHAGYEEGIRAALSRDELAGKLSGTMAEGLRVEAGYEVAAATALGVQLQAIKVHDGAEVIAFGRQNDLERCRFQLPRHVAPVTFPAGKPLREVVEFDASCQDFIAMLDGIFIVNDLTDHCHDLLPHGCCLVTLEGEVLTWQGNLLIGQGESREQQLLDNKRRIEELTREKGALSSQVEGLEQQRMLCEQRAEDCRDQCQELTLLCQRRQLHLQELEKERSRTVRELERVDERFELLLFDADQFAEEEELLLVQQRELEEQVCLIRERQHGLNEALLQGEALLEREREKLSELKQVLAELEVDFARAQERQQQLNNDLLREQKAVVDQQQRQKDRQQRLEYCAEELVRLQGLQAEGQVRLQVLLERRQREQQQQCTMDERTRLLQQQVDHLDQQGRHYRTALNQATEQQNHLQMKVREHHLELEHLHQTIRDKYQVDLTRQADFDSQQIHQASEKLHKLRVRLEAFGEVNLMAIEEFTALEERFEFLEKQREDVHASIEDLQTAISRINRTTRKRFKEAFEQVNEQFKLVFPRLFVGGEAELRLTDESDLLESGIDIIAQPPGKKLQNVGLLSGGEKALTAVALIFAIFLIKPSPFCVLDEVDAPLDDANIGRFNDMVKEMSRSSQFVVITHNTRTMEIADTLFGVTMEEPGVSSLVAVRMDELAAS
nr:chromosome segregation protein SMC [uncultured Desulfuromonas sp.]